MTDTNKLNDLIRQSGLKKKFIAEKLNLTYYGFKKKLDNLNEFKSSEIIMLCKLLNINSLREREEIFFAKEVDK